MPYLSTTNVAKMSPFLSVIKRIVPRHQLSWSCLSAAIYAPLRQRHSQNEGGQPFVDTQRGKESKEIQSHDFHSDEKFSKKSLHRYISHDIQLANLELNELLEQEEGTRQLSVEQLGMIELHEHCNISDQWINKIVYISLLCRTPRISHV